MNTLTAGRCTRGSWMRWMLLGVVLSCTEVGQLTAAAALPSDEGCHEGYRQMGVLLDPTLGKKWLILSNCTHPERPRLAFALDGLNRDRVAGEGFRMLQSSSKPVISSTDGTIPDQPILGHDPKFGENEVKRGNGIPSDPVLPVIAVATQVRLWRRDGITAIDLAGTALDGGQKGTTIRVKLAIGKQVLWGVIRGPGSVELTLPHAAGFNGAGQ